MGSGQFEKHFRGVKIYFTLVEVFKVSKGGVGAIQKILSNIKEILSDQ